MKTHNRLTSAQRFAIFQIVDRAIDVTQQGEWIADAEYGGDNHLVRVCARPVGVCITDPEGEMLVVFLNRRPGETEASHRDRIHTELGAAYDYLIGLLNNAGATS